MHSQPQLSLNDIADGDRISVSFDPALKDPHHGSISRAEGVVRKIVGLCFLMVEEKRAKWSMAPTIEINEDRLASLTLIERAEDIRAARETAARGELVFREAPETAQELEAQLTDLAQMIAIEQDDRILGGRKGQLIRQFNDIADLVDLAKTKRNYLLTRARVGEDFHPYLTRNDKVFRNETVRPLPADFEFSRAKRIDRVQRLDQSVRIFGEAEREVRRLASALRQQGYDVRRPHPNAQELYIRITEGRARADLQVKASSNGLWEASAVPPDNKTKAKALKRILSMGHLRTLADEISTIF
jgi:hypothetical protein